MTIYDRELLELQALASNYGDTLREFNQEFYKEKPFFNLERPVLHLNKDNEFIIQVPLLKDKVQYIPFTYGGLTVEMLT